MTPTELKALIRTVPDFPAPGIQFRDITPLLADPAGLAASISGLAKLARAAGAQAIAGIEARGFVFGAAVALQLGVGFIPLRKGGKLPVAVISQDYALEYGTAQLELDPTLILAGQTIVLVDDLLATGGTALAGTGLLRRAGANCVDALFVIDLPELGGGVALAEAGVTAKALMAFEGH